MEGELGELQSHYEAQLVTKDELLTQKDQQLQQHIKTSSQRYSQKQGFYDQIIVGGYSYHLLFITPNFFTYMYMYVMEYFSGISKTLKFSLCLYILNRSSYIMLMLLAATKTMSWLALAIYSMYMCSNTIYMYVCI